MPNHYQNQDQLFYALSDATRRAVIERLVIGSASVSELAKPFEMALPSFMQHLSVLEDSGIIRSEKIGRVRTVTLEAKPLEQVENWLEMLRRKMERQFDQLDDYLLQLKEKEND